MNLIYLFLFKTFSDAGHKDLLQKNLVKKDETGNLGLHEKKKDLAVAVRALATKSVVKVKTQKRRKRLKQDYNDKGTTERHDYQSRVKFYNQGYVSLFKSPFYFSMIFLSSVVGLVIIISYDRIWKGICEPLFLNFSVKETGPVPKYFLDNPSWEVLIHCAKKFNVPAFTQVFKKIQEKNQAELAKVLPNISRISGSSDNGVFNSSFIMLEEKVLLDFLLADYFYTDEKIEVKADEPTKKLAIIEAFLENSTFFNVEKDFFQLNVSTTSHFLKLFERLFGKLNAFKNDKNLIVNTFAFSFKSEDSTYQNPISFFLGATNWQESVYLNPSEFSNRNSFMIDYYYKGASYNYKLFFGLNG